LGDALALSFAVPFYGNMTSAQQIKPARRVGRGGY
jgi:hypothetical protein